MVARRTSPSLYKLLTTIFASVIPAFKAKQLVRGVFFYKKKLLTMQILAHERACLSHPVIDSSCMAEPISPGRDGMDVPLRTLQRFSPPSRRLKACGCVTHAALLCCVTQWPVYLSP
eukprot:TRINITY_DN1982_c0_g5_i1.p1 TRINITY_DN1982_c0_g5~~TRINITY_DN1982_c0_g5_i1.p1  ORF type:complete len:117 (+),score=2.94 TRINITY_DN1982_c0_g5_i1:47-397(+)